MSEHIFVETIMSELGLVAGAASAMSIARGKLIDDGEVNDSRSAFQL
jgi:hypothetical protein